MANIARISPCGRSVNVSFGYSTIQIHKLFIHSAKLRLKRGTYFQTLFQTNLDAMTTKLPYYVKLSCTKRGVDMITYCLGTTSLEEMLRFQEAFDNAKAAALEMEAALLRNRWTIPSRFIEADADTLPF